MTSPQAALREATDRRLWDEVISRGRATRAELAASTGLSKPTVSESVQRLADAALLDATGRQETGHRGRVGTLYELGSAAGWVLAIEVDQSGVLARAADLGGRPLHDHRRSPGAAGDTRALTRALRSAARKSLAAMGDRHGPLRAVAVSMANPVHPETHEVVALPDSPFPEGLISPADALDDVVGVPVLVDNDVNLAALAEHRSGAATGVASFAYVYVGAGLGLGLYVGDQVIRGAHGLAGEIGYLPGSGRATLAAELAADGIGRPDAPSNDVDAVLELLDGPRGLRVLTTLSKAIARAVASVTAVVDPALVLLGGPVGTHPAVLPAVRDALAATSPLPTRLAHGTLGALAPLHGATQLALDHARSAAITRRVNRA